MSDSPLPPQTDYPYAARMRVGSAVSAASVSPQPSVFGRLAGRLNAWLDWQPRDVSSPAHARDIFSATALVAIVSALMVINGLPFVSLELFEQAPSWLRMLIVAPQFAIIAAEFVVFAVLLVWWRGGIFPATALVAIVSALIVINGLSFVSLWLFEQAPPWLGILILAPQFGIIAGEFIVFAVVLVWWRGGILERLAVHWLLVLALYCLWALGFAIYWSLQRRDGQAILDDTWQIFAAIPTISLALQAPLWCLRIYGGWRLQDLGSSASSSPANPLSIRDVLVGTAAIAVSLALLRVMFDNPADVGPGFWIRWAIACLAISLLSILIVAPLMRLILVLKDWRLAALGSLMYWAFIATLIFTVFFFLNPPGGWRLPTLIIVLTTLAGFATVSLPLWLARAMGNRLQIGKA